MPDDLRIPDVGLAGRERTPLSSGPVTHGYRARPMGGAYGLDWMKIAAAALGGILLLAVAGYAVMGRHPAAVPVIEADSRPIRVKPDNPGGMQIAGADELTLSDDRTSRDGMAPAAEVPAPQALRAQMQQAEPVPAPAAVPAAISPAAQTVPTPGASPLPDTTAQATTPPGVAAGPAIGPKIAARTATPSPAPARSTENSVPKGGSPVAEAATMVQLGALSSEAAARSEWQRLARSLPGLLGGRAPAVTKLERDGRTYWRLRTGGFADIADATAFCGKLKAKGDTCAIASF